MSMGFPSDPSSGDYAYSMASDNKKTLDALCKRMGQMEQILDAIVRTEQARAAEMPASGNDAELRLECLRFATAALPTDADSHIANAAKFYEFVIGKRA